MAKEMQKSVLICPSCKSKDVGVDNSVPVSAVMQTAPYACYKCGHMAPIFPEINLSDVDRFQADVANKDKGAKRTKTLVDANYGKFMTKGMWKFEAPLVIILGLFITIFFKFFGSTIGSIFILLGLWMGYVAYIKKA